MSNFVGITGKDGLIHDGDDDPENQAIIVDDDGVYFVEGKIQTDWSDVKEIALQEEGLFRIELRGGLTVLTGWIHWDEDWLETNDKECTGNCDHVQLLANLTRHLKDGGEVIFCNNMRGFTLDESISEYGFDFENISEKTLPRDFARDKKIHTCYRLTFNKADMVKQPEPMTSGKAAPKWQKSLSAKSETYHDYTDRNDYEESVRETLTNKVWGNAKASTSSYKTQKQGRFTRSDSEFNSDSPRRNRFEDGKSGSGPVRDNRQWALEGEGLFLRFGKRISRSLRQGRAGQVPPP